MSKGEDKKEGEKEEKQGDEGKKTDRRKNRKVGKPRNE